MKTRLKDKTRELKPWQKKLHTVIFEADTSRGKLFDMLLLSAILLSITVVMLDSVSWINAEIGFTLLIIEYVLTALFTLEYIARIACVKKPWQYIFSFYGIIDLLSIMPVYIGLFIPHSTRSLTVIRSLRLLRVFRILKLARYIGEAQKITQALKKSRIKITVFFFSVISIVIIMGTLMYILESPESGFTSIPRSIYWAIITLTTVGYGDVVPETIMGQALSSIIMIIGYAIIAVPTGIVTNELAQVVQKKNATNTEHCPNCMQSQHDDDAKYCKICGTGLKYQSD